MSGSAFNRDVLFNFISSTENLQYMINITLLTKYSTILQIHLWLEGEGKKKSKTT